MVEDKYYKISEIDKQNLYWIMNCAKEPREELCKWLEDLESKTPLPEPSKDNKQVVIDALDKWFNPTNGNKLDIDIAKERHKRIATNLLSKFEYATPEKMREILDKAIDNLLKDQSIWTDEKEVLQATHLKDVEWYMFITELIKELSQLVKPEPPITEDKVREIFLRNSKVREFELKDGSKVGYRVLGIEQGERMIQELSNLISNDKGEIIAEFKGRVWAYPSGIEIGNTDLKAVDDAVIACVDQNIKITITKIGEDK